MTLTLQDYSNITSGSGMCTVGVHYTCVLSCAVAVSRVCAQAVVAVQSAEYDSCGRT
jgi:hypothetical protein